MRLLITRSRWEFPDLPLPLFLTKVKEAGYDGTDIYLPSLKDSPEDVRRMHDDAGLSLFGMITTEGATAAQHRASLRPGFDLAARTGAVHLNCHPGKDFFSFDENCEIFAESLSLSREYGIPFSHETHRGRALFSTLSTRALLEALPDIRLTADFSHWCCVHESLLHDQEEIVALAIRRSDYIHARVGYIEGPQVSDPRAPEWKTELETHLMWWKQIAAQRREAGANALGVCPEFGAPPYMPLLPFTRQPVTDLWEVTLWMKDLLRRELA
jgi:sugar phosphate isomerase/epimerase